MTLERVFTEQQPLLRRRLARMTGDAEVAEDLCQEVFVRAWRSAPREAPAVAIAAWLHRTASNLAVDELRRRSRRPVAAVEQLDGLLAPPAAQDDDGAARAALAQLAPHDRLVLLLRFHAEPLVLLLVREEDPAPYEAWLEHAGARVRTMTGGIAERDVLFADALVVSGSHSDVHPRVYGERPGPHLHGRPDFRDDWRDLATLRAALRADLPIIGVCRGHQLLNVLSGGSLAQHLGADPAAPRHLAADAHEISTAGASAVRALVGRRSSVPSEHHQAIRRLGRRLRVSAVTADGVVESVERTDHRFAVGVQWKPPHVPDAAPSRRLAEALVDRASRRA